MTMPSIRDVAVATVCALLITGCGGGGGGSDSGSGSSGTGGGTPTASMAVDKTSVSISTQYGNPAVSRSVRVTASNVPTQGLYVLVTSTGTAIASTVFNAVSATQGEVILQFPDPLDMPVGVATSSVTIKVCYDDQCAQEVRGSPAMVAVSYAVEDATTVALATSSVSATADVTEASPEPKVTVNLTRAPETALTFQLASTSRNVAWLNVGTRTAGNVELQLQFNSPGMLGIGTWTEDVTLRACYDSMCRHVVSGSPMVVHTQYTVVHNEPVEPDMTPLPYVSRTALTHDVVDAEYVRPLDAIVMVSKAPSNALYLYDVATGTEKSVALNRVPSSVSVAPDGSAVAVGHDAMITHVDLASLVAGSPATKLLNVSTGVFDLVLDGRGVVHALPVSDQWVNMHSVNVATNVETLGTGILRAGAHARLHPSGDYLYAADNGLSPSDIAKWDLRGGTAALMYDSPYHGDYGMCGDLWFKEDGATLYTKCGNTFRSSTTRAEDMLYSGKLALSSASYYAFAIDSLSQSDATHEIMLIESDVFNCTYGSYSSPCYNHVAIYESDFLNRTLVYTVPPITVAGVNVGQRGLFVFHSRDGQHRYMISRLAGAAGEFKPHYVTVVR